MKRTVITHGHIFKNAGTSFDWSLRRNFADNFLDHRDGMTMRKQGRKHLFDTLAERPELLALSSHHLCWPLPAPRGVTLLPVYLLRHPIMRMFSVYQFEKQQEADGEQFRIARANDFQGYTRWRLEQSDGPVIRNYQVRYLAGIHDRRSDADIDHAVYQQALAHLDQSQCGLVERYDDSMIIFENDLRQFFPQLDLAYMHRNRSSQQDQQAPEPTAEQLLNELGGVADTALTMNKLDLILYENAQQRLNKALDKLPDADLRRADFAARCLALRAADLAPNH